MLSRSYSNLDLASAEFPPASSSGKMAAAEKDEDGAKSSDSPSPSSPSRDRIIIVANQLPIITTRCSDGDQRWSFAFDEDSILIQLKLGFPEDLEVFYIGSLRAVDIPPNEQDDVARSLLDKFNCVPTFIPNELNDQFYQGFCKQHLWPLFHYRLPFSPDNGGQFDLSLWKSYVAANRIFSKCVIEILNPKTDYVWIHDYHLMALPSILRHQFIEVRIGFFLHSPFPSSEIYRTLPVREEILLSLLNCDVVGFHTFDYARHFLSCCSRMLGLDYQSKRGYIGIDYLGRTVGIKILPVGIHLGRFQKNLALPEKERIVSALRKQFDGFIVFLGVDDMDVFKGIHLKLIAFEEMLRCHSDLQGKTVLVQITNPARGRGCGLEEYKDRIHKTCRSINEEFGKPDYVPVVLIDRPVSVVEKIAYYTVADCVVVTPVRDGMNLTPYEYIVSRQGVSSPDSNDSMMFGPRSSMLVISEFIGCSPSLSGAIRVNPWDTAMTADAMNDAISMSEVEKLLRHEKHYNYISTHDVAYWSRSFLQDMMRISKDHSSRKWWGLGLGLRFRVVALDSNFEKLKVSMIVPAYEMAKSRAILLDYDGTVMPQASSYKPPSLDVISVINSLCADKRNVVFIVSGRGKDNLRKWFSPCQKLGLAAEHGYFVSWNKNAEWETCGPIADFGWMQITEPVMKHYLEATDGSTIETKESSLVWRYQDTDSGFGSSQAKEVLDHLESVLANEPVSVKSGKFIVEVKPQGVSKGMVVEKILSSMAAEKRPADFVLCIGDDRSDEDMFEGIASVTARELMAPGANIFGCTVGQKPSKAKYYLDDDVDVIRMLTALANTQPH